MKGFITGMVFQDGQIQIPHVEMDYSYTLIGIPYFYKENLEFVFEF